jgi:DNA-binding NarL/FixJ family response regulator
MHSESLYAERALRAGAMGYINKDQATEETIKAIRRLMEGEVYLSEAMSQRM